MQLRISPRHRVVLELRRVEPPLEYTPVLLDQGHLKKLSSVPYFIYQRDKHRSNDYKVARMIVDKLKTEGLYKQNLLFAGFRGIYLYKHGSYGKRKQTYAVTEKAFYKSVTDMWRNRHYTNSPFLHMDVAGKSMPAIGVFDASQLVGGRDFGEHAGRLPQQEKITWWTDDGTSIDRAAVAVFFFKQYDSYDEFYGTQVR